MKFGIIVDVEASRAIRQAEVGAAKSMIDRTEGRFGLKPKRLAADSAYGSAPTLDWLVNKKKIEPHIPVIDMERREDGTFSRDDFNYDKARDVYTCPAGKLLTTTGRIRYDDMRPYRASKRDCDACPLKMQCCPKDTSRQVLRNVYEEARDVARAISPAPKPLSNLVVTANALRCCSLISSAFCGSAACGYAGRAVLSLSSCWRRSRKIFAGSSS